MSLCVCVCVCLCVRVCVYVYVYVYVTLKPMIEYLLKDPTQIHQIQFNTQKHCYLYYLSSRFNIRPFTLI